jgi:hypothetical protein
LVDVVRKVGEDAAHGLQTAPRRADANQVEQCPSQ